MKKLPSLRLTAAGVGAWKSPLGYSINGYHRYYTVRFKDAVIGHAVYMEDAKKIIKSHLSGFISEASQESAVAHA